MLQSRNSMAEVNTDLLPLERKHCLKNGWVKRTAPVNPLSGLYSLLFPRKSWELQAVALMLWFPPLHLILRTNSTTVTFAGSLLVGEGTYNPRTGKLCLLACLVPECAARRFDRVQEGRAAAYQLTWPTAGSTDMLAPLARAEVSARRALRSLPRGTDNLIAFDLAAASPGRVIPRTAWLLSGAPVSRTR